MGHIKFWTMEDSEMWGVYSNPLWGSDCFRWKMCTSSQVLNLPLLQSVFMFKLEVIKYFSYFPWLCSLSLLGKQSTMYLSAAVFANQRSINRKHVKFLILIGFAFWLWSISSWVCSQVNDFSSGLSEHLLSPLPTFNQAFNTHPKDEHWCTSS